MKILSILLFSLLITNNTIITKNTETLKATYDGYEDGVYYFSDDDDTYEFKNADPKVLKAYDLSSKKYEGQDFNITYEIEKKIDEDDEEFEVWTISKLELIEK